MSVRLSLLAILDQGPCYGYQLRSEYERRTGAARVNVGQIYTTLERLERDGLVRREGTDEHGHVYWGITPAGSSAAADWMRAPDERGARDDLVHKLALAATLPGVDAVAAIAVQRDAAEKRLIAVDAAPAPTDTRALILTEAARAHARADLAWLDAIAAAVSSDESARTFALSRERPRRGRPARAVTDAA